MEKFKYALELKHNPENPQNTINANPAGVTEQIKAQAAYSDGLNEGYPK